MLNVGLTGGIACGKSTVADMLVKLGAHLIDFDKLAHEVQEPGKPAWKEIVRIFGREVLAADESIDRLKLGGIVFADKQKLQVLNGIVHPCIDLEWRDRLNAIRKIDEHAVILSDIPLLFEVKMQSIFDLILLIFISPEEQITRLMARNGFSLEEARARLKSQMPITDKVSLADMIIDNQGTMADTEKKVQEAWQELLRREKAER